MIDYSVKSETIKEAYSKTAYNYIIRDYYKKLAIDEQDETYYNRAKKIDECYKFFNLDYYLHNNIADITSISLCNDKFCKNCQNLLSKQRYIHYKPYLDELSEEYDLYHITLTVPNTVSNDLNITLNKMYLSFAKFIKIFRRKNSRHKYLDLENLGYQGCVRSLEITYNNQNGYHPHFHCIFAFKKDINQEQKYINDFSYSNCILKRKFTRFEITIQKLWYMIYNSIRITEKSFEELEQGYSCIAELTNYDYKEVFKYTLKESFDDILDSEEVFYTLRTALYNRRIIQGYGCLFGICDDDEDIKQDIDIAYKEYLQELTGEELPHKFTFEIDNVFTLLDNNTKLITRKSIKEIINYDEEE